MTERDERVPFVTVLGSGTLTPDASRHGAAHLVRGRGVLLLLDCGWGTLDGLARHDVRWQELTHVALTHFHTDHVSDLASLFLALTYGIDPPRTTPLTVIGPVGVAAFLAKLGEVMGSHVTDPGFPVRVVELDAAASFEDTHGALRVSCHPTPHTETSVAYRVEVDGAVLGYTGDTGPSEEVVAFLSGCDVLISECTQPDPPEQDTHLSPESLARLARTASPGTLVVTHVGAPSTPEAAAAAVAERWRGRVYAGRDGLRVPLTS